MIEQSGNSIRYPGGKNAVGTWQWIAGLLPTHSVYVEPFVGSGAVLRNKPPALRSIALDMDGEVTRWLSSLDMPGVEVEQTDAMNWLEAAGDIVTDDWCLYLDPPYLHSTRTKNQIYKYELSRQDHERILAAIADLNCAVLISGYESQLYSSHLASWYRSERVVTTRGGLRTEVVWCNFEPAEVSPHNPRWPGGDYRERERIGRKAKRWRRMFAVLPRHERRALLGQLLDAERELDGEERSR